MSKTSSIERSSFLKNISDDFFSEKDDIRKRVARGSRKTSSFENQSKRAYIEEWEKKNSVINSFPKGDNESAHGENDQMTCSDLPSITIVIFLF